MGWGGGGVVDVLLYARVYPYVHASCNELKNGPAPVCAASLSLPSSVPVGLRAQRSTLHPGCDARPRQAPLHNSWSFTTGTKHGCGCTVWVKRLVVVGGWVSWRGGGGGGADGVYSEPVSSCKLTRTQLIKNGPVPVQWSLRLI